MNQSNHSRDFYGVRSGILFLGNEIKQQINHTNIGAVVTVTRGYFTGKQFTVIGKGRLGGPTAHHLFVDAQSERDS